MPKTEWAKFGDVYRGAGTIIMVISERTEARTGRRITKYLHLHPGKAVFYAENGSVSACYRWSWWKLIENGQELSEMESV